MPERSRYIFVFLFSLAALTMHAQEADDVIQDTLVNVVEVPAEEQQDTVTFDLAGQPSAVLTRQIPQKNIDSLKSDDAYWYANTTPPKKKQAVDAGEKRGKSIFEKQWFRDLLWVLILGSFIVIVLWYLVSSNILVFRKKPKQIGPEESETETIDDIFTINYDREIARATDAKNYRLAVRLWYLRSLKELADKGKIDYRYGRTNQDYVLQLYRSPYYKDFFRLTRNFEYTWYGQFDLSAEAYEMMRSDFTTFKNSLR